MNALEAPGMRPVPQLDRDDVAQAASQLESFFVRQFLAMARPKGGMLDGGFAGDTFHDMLDGAISDSVAGSGGLGLASTFEAALGGEGGVPVARPHALTMVDTITAQRALDGPSPGAADEDGLFVRPAPGRFSSGFGPRVDPLGAGQGFHPGLDIAAAQGTPVVAAAGGKVVHAGPAGTYGNMIAVQLPDGTETRYAHLSAVGVKVGQQVTAGAPLGAVGSTGRSTGPHLHFEVRRDGHAVDPRPYLDGASARGAQEPPK